jgi:hypothetical protein
VLADGPPRSLVRPGFVALILALALPLLACAEVERTVTERAVLPDDAGEARTIAWESNRYPGQAVRLVDDQCWGVAAVGQPVPRACLSARVLASESDPFEQAPWPASAGVLLAISALVLIAWKRVAWQPVVARTTAGAPHPRPFDPGDAVALMRNTEDERASRVVAEGRRRDLSRPGLVGLLIPVPPLALLTLLFGYGATFAWGFITGLLLFVGVVTVNAFVLLSARRPAGLEATVSRLLFLWGATATLLLGSFVALLWRAPLLELHGVDWPL